MLTINRAIKHRGKLHRLNLAAVIGVIAMSFATSVNAQSRTADSFNFDEISVGGKNSWNFSSEDETVSIRDNLQQLREYDISNIENFDLRLIRERRRRLGIKNWGNRGDRSYYSIESGFYPYYFPNSRFYNYY